MIKQGMAADAVEANAAKTHHTGDGTPAQPTARPAALDSGGLMYGLGALASLAVGLFLLGIPSALLALYLSDQAIKRGAKGFGTLMKWVSLLYLGVLVISLFLSAGRP